MVGTLATSLTTPLPLLALLMIKYEAYQSLGDPYQSLSAPTKAHPSLDDPYQSLLKP